MDWIGLYRPGRIARPMPIAPTFASWIREAECDGVRDENLPAGSTARDHREQRLHACGP